MIGVYSEGQGTCVQAVSLNPKANKATSKTTLPENRQEERRLRNVSELLTILQATEWNVRGL